MTKQIIPKIADHSDKAQERLASEFQGKPLIEGFLNAFTTQTQRDEDAFHKFLSAFDIPTAIGGQLDLIGKIVGAQRSGRADDEYRIAILAKIAINTSKGTGENVISVFSLLTGATLVNVLEYFPCVVDIFGNVNFAYDYENDGEDSFAFDGGVDGEGFGDFFDSSIGGVFAGLILFDVQALYSVMDSVLAGGVRLENMGFFTDNPFSFFGDTDGDGFGNFLDTTIGGEFATIVLP